MKRELTYATFCSGIECCSVACIGLPMKPVFFSEIEPFPCAVLKAHYPNVPNLGDMSKIRRNDKGDITNGTTTIPFPDGGIDILAAGCPCQDFSVAGKRAGGEEGSGTRSSFIFEFIRIVGEVRPRWFIYENVVGMLSTNEGRDFAHILLAFRDCGFSVCYRTLDSQYVRVDGMERAVPQRRRRVWVVGRLGADVTLPAEVLFEPDCVAGHTAPRRRAGQGFAYFAPRRDRVDAGLVGEPARCDILNFQGSKGNNCVTDDGSCPNLNAMHGHDVHVVAQEGGGCLNPLDPQSKRLFTPGGVMQTLGAQAENTGQNTPGVCIALDGDKLKPREDANGGGNQTTFGGGTASPAARKERTMSHNFELYDNADEVSVSLSAKRVRDTLVVREKEGAEGE